MPLLGQASALGLQQGREGTGDGDTSVCWWPLQQSQSTLLVCSPAKFLLECGFVLLQQISFCFFF